MIAGIESLDIYSPGLRLVSKFLIKPAQRKKHTHNYLSRSFDFILS